jgi:hypothetical protein
VSGVFSLITAPGCRNTRTIGSAGPRLPGVAMLTTWIRVRTRRLAGVHAYSIGSNLQRTPGTRPGATGLILGAATPTTSGPPNAFVGAAPRRGLHGPQAPALPGRRWASTPPPQNGDKLPSAYSVSSQQILRNGPYHCVNEIRAPPRPCFRTPQTLLSLLEGRRHHHMAASLHVRTHATSEANRQQLICFFSFSSGSVQEQFRDTR